MYPRGHRELGALVVLLVLLTSGLAALPWNAQAQGHQIVGLVQECVSSTTFVSGATVTLTEANGQRSPMTTPTGGDGTFSFEPGTGNYLLSVERDGYFDNASTAPFRFDNTETVERNFCLEKTPTADRTLSLLIVTDAATPRTNEIVNFPKTSISNENAAPTWNTAGNTVRLSQTPVSSQGVEIRYTNTPLGGTRNNFLFVNTTHYRWLDYWTGTIEILDGQAISDLDTDPNRVYVNVSYSKWTPVSRLAFFPVDDLAPRTARKNGAVWPDAGNWSLNLDTGIVTILRNLIDGTDTLAFDYSSLGAIGSASVDVYYSPEDQVVASKTTDASGRVTFTLFSGVFELRTTRSGYSPDRDTVDMSTGFSVTRRVRMEAGVTVVGHARDSAGRFISSGLQGWLYRTEVAEDPEKAIRADVVGSLYTFHAPPGTYIMVIDANGYRANVTTRSFLTTPPTPVNAVLQPAGREEYRMTIIFGASDWNNFTIYRNLTLNGDTTFPGLSPTGLRDIRLQVDYTFGTTKDGAVSAAEADAFRDWLIANGPLHVTTDGFFSANGKAYISAIAYAVTVQGLTASGSPVWINTTATYSLKDTPYISFGAKRYFVNLTAAPDVNVSVLQDQVYEVVLPRTYEMVSSVITPTGSVTTEGFTRITVDPAVAANPQIRMTIERSDSGTARAKVSGPVGKFHVVNASFDNYRAFVANDTDLTFSARDSTDPVGDITTANFTWRFLANASGANDPANIRYGIEPTFKYAQAGEYVVNLTVVEAGGNVTTRNITVWVDDQLPIAKIRTNKTGSAALANGTTIRINEDQPIRFDGGLSSDLAFANATYGGTKAGVILEGGYAWDFNGDGITDATSRIVNWTFDKPGNFTVNLTVTDSVGWKSANTTVILLVNDTTGPTADFVILDPSNEWEVLPPTATLTEGKTYSFNASRTTDNFDKVEVLNFTWTIPGPIAEGPRTNNTFYGMNITFTWTEFNSSYRVVLKATDKGFEARPGNSNSITRSIPVGIDSANRPNLQVQGATLNVLPDSNPADGDSITVRVNVTNQAGRGVARNVSGELSLISGTQTISLTRTVGLENKDGTSRTDGTIAPGETVVAVFTAFVTGGQGNKSLQVFVTADREAWTQLVDNKAATFVDVRQSVFQQLAFYGSIVGVLALFVFYMVYRRKVRAGDWRPLRARRREKVEGEEKRPKKEVKEEKKRL